MNWLRAVRRWSARRPSRAEDQCTCSQQLGEPDPALVGSLTRNHHGQDMPVPGAVGYHDQHTIGQGPLPAVATTRRS